VQDKHALGDGDAGDLVELDFDRREPLLKDRTLIHVPAGVSNRPGTHVQEDRDRLFRRKDA
jgi:hypothetical protein